MLEASQPEALSELALMLARDPAARGEVLVTLRLGGERQPDPVLHLGRDFVLDGDLVDRLSGIAGIGALSLTARRADHLQLAA